MYTVFDFEITKITYLDYVTPLDRYRLKLQAKYHNHAHIMRSISTRFLQLTVAVRLQIIYLHMIHVQLPAKVSSINILFKHIIIKLSVTKHKPSSELHTDVIVPTD